MSAVCDAGASKPSPGLSCGTVGGSSGGKPSRTLYLTVRSGCGGTKLGAGEVAGGWGWEAARCLSGCGAGGAACFGVSAASFCGGAVASSGAAAGAGGGGGADFEERSTASEGSRVGSSGFGGASSLGGAPTSAGETRSTVGGASGDEAHRCPS